MKNNFFAYIARMKLIRRWSLMKSVSEENIAEHSAQVAQIAHALALIKNRLFGGELDADRIAVMALYHETSEVLTGDLPTPIKYYNPEIRRAYKDIEKIANDKLLSMLPGELRGDYEEIIVIDMRYSTASVKGIINKYGITDAIIINNIQASSGMQSQLKARLES